MHFIKSKILIVLTDRRFFLSGEFFIDVDLPVQLTYKSNKNCDAANMNKTVLTNALNEAVNTIPSCNNRCVVNDLELKCEADGSGSKIFAKFNVMFPNIRPNEVPKNCTDRCQRQNMRQILASSVG